MFLQTKTVNLLHETKFSLVRFDKDKGIIPHDIFIREMYDFLMNIIIGNFKQKCCLV